MIWDEKTIKADIENAKKSKSKVMLVESDLERGVEYPYFLYIPENADNTMVMDCLNYSEPELEEGEVENHETTEMVYSWFSDFTKKASTPKELS